MAKSARSGAKPEAATQSHQLSPQQRRRALSAAEAQRRQTELESEIGNAEINRVFSVAGVPPVLGQPARLLQLHCTLDQLGIPYGEWKVESCPESLTVESVLEWVDGIRASIEPTEQGAAAVYLSNKSTAWGKAYRSALRGYVRGIWTLLERLRAVRAIASLPGKPPAWLGRDSASTSGQVLCELVRIRDFLNGSRIGGTRVSSNRVAAAASMEENKPARRGRPCKPDDELLLFLRDFEDQGYSLQHRGHRTAFAKLKGIEPATARKWLGKAVQKRNEISRVSKPLEKSAKGGSYESAELSNCSRFSS